MIDPQLVTGLAAAAVAFLLVRSARPRRAEPEPAPEPVAEVWVRRTTTVEEFRATGTSAALTPVAGAVFDPQYQTLRPQVPMIERPR